jgi:capsular exopolysaccharide synthesis family protein
VTSSAPGEGKSTVAANLAVTYAEQGARVALVDADLRRPQLHRILPVDRVPGLTEYLTGKAELADVIRRVETVDRLDLIPAGRGVENPPALLDSERFEELVASLRSNYSVVILDTPPLLAVTDAGLVGARVDGAMLVIRANETSADVVERATGQLRRLGASLLGVILNDVPVGGMYASSGYSYYDDYMDEEELGEEAGTDLLTRPPEEKSA